MKISPKAAVSDFAPSRSVHLVQRAPRVTRLLAGSKRGIERDVAGRLQVNPGADSLKEQLVHESRAHNRSRSHGHIAKVVVIKVE